MRSSTTLPEKGRHFPEHLLPRTEAAIIAVSITMGDIQHLDTWNRPHGIDHLRYKSNVASGFSVRRME
jgi:hypothetical protein